MMNAKTILLAGLVGTSAMTAFSYAVSQIRKKNFKEPLLLALLLQGWQPAIKDRFAYIGGGSFHYTVGWAWTGMYALLLDKANRKPALFTALIFGCSGGIIGVLIWKSFFKLNPNPPQLHYREFYRHLIIAHLLFSTSMSETFCLLTNAQSQDGGFI